MFKVFTLLLCSLMTFITFSATAADDGPCIMLLREQTVSPLQFDDPKMSELFLRGGKPEGATFSKESLEWLAKTRDILRANHRIITDKVIGSDSVYRMAAIMRIIRSTGIMQGRTGGGKTLFVKLFAEQEQEKVFKLTLGIETPGTYLTGGYDSKAFDAGEVLLNIKTSMPSAPFFILDELDKALPHILSSVLPILERKRWAWAGVQEIQTDIKTESGILVSNATLGELDKILRKQALDKLMQALISRLAFKSYVSGALTPEEGMQLDRIEDERAIRETYGHWNKPDQQAIKAEEKIQKVDWDGLYKISRLLFLFSDQTKTAAGILFNNYLSWLKGEISTKNNTQTGRQNDARAFPYVSNLEPSARARSIFRETVAVSALVDFLLSPLADDLSGLKPIMLSPLSLWRLHYLTTSTVMGRTSRLLLPRSVNGQPDEFRIQYGYEFPEADVLDFGMKTFYDDERSQQMQFAQVYNNEAKAALDALLNIFKMLGPNAASLSHLLGQSADFEALIDAAQPQ